jgi:signal transduction histidine kinase
MRERFPDVEVQGKGLLATEGAVSIPLLHTTAPVAAVVSHYLEFVPDGDTERTCTLDQLDVGATYEVVITTGGGLYRYRLRDLVRVEGHLLRAPLLSFQGRADRASDLAGEKLTPALVERALSAAMQELGIATPFALIAPSVEPRAHYSLYVEADRGAAERLASAVEERLRTAHHYALCRSLGQLAAMQGVAIVGGERAYERACTARGQRAGAIKPPALDPALDWAHHFESCKVA